MKQPRHLLAPLALLLAANDCHAELLAHYKFDEAAAAPTALNAVAGSPTGAVGANITTGVAGISGNAYSFIGAAATQADCVDMGNASFFTAINTSGKLSFTAWVKTTDTTGNRNCVVFAGDDTVANVYTDMGVAAGQAGALGAVSARNRPATAPAGAQQTGIYSTPTVAAVNDGAWHHLVMTVELSTAKLELWVDGVLANTQTMPSPFFPTFKNFEIGRLGRGTPVDAYSGLVDDVQVYDHVLTPGQIGYLKNHPGTAYTAADSEPDGLADAWEILHFGDITSQNGAGDPDSDGATNLEEQAAGTNPTLADTDGDGRTDGAELHTFPFSDPLDADTDNDGLTDGAEVNTHHTDPNTNDSDFDGLPDAWEISNSLNPISDAGDNGEFGDPDLDGLVNVDEYHGGVGSTNPRDPDTDHDGYNDKQENRFGAWDDITATGTDPNNPDSDGDGLLDGQENPGAAYVAGVTSGTDPNKLDTDGDGFNDKLEFVAGTNPTNGAVFPVAAKGLVAHYKFDEAAAATTATSALGNSPGAVGSSVVTGVTGVSGKAYQFGNLFGQADIVDMGNAAFLADILSTKALTYTAWIKSTDVSSGRNVFISTANSNLANSYVDFAISGGAPNIGALCGRLRPDGNVNIAEAFSNTAPSTVLVNTDTWHHVAMTIDLATTSLKLYVDGTPVAENNAIAAAAVFPVFNNFEVGRLGRLVPTDAYQGLIDDVQVYNEALAPARIAALFAMPGVSADEDHDRLDDQWEIDHFGSITAQNGSGDPDGDSILNEAEETAGTDPGTVVNPAVAAKVTSVSFISGGNYVINFTGTPNTTYRVTKSVTLGGFTAMTPPVSAMTNGSGVGVATVPAVEATGPKNFYRLEVP